MWPSARRHTRLARRGPPPSSPSAASPRSGGRPIAAACCPGGAAAAAAKPHQGGAHHTRRHKNRKPCASLHFTCGDMAGTRQVSASKRQRSARTRPPGRPAPASMRASVRAQITQCIYGSRTHKKKPTNPRTHKHKRTPGVLECRDRCHTRHNRRRTVLSCRSTSKLLVARIGIVAILSKLPRKRVRESRVSAREAGGRLAQACAH